MPATCPPKMEGNKKERRNTNGINPLELGIIRVKEIVEEHYAKHDEQHRGDDPSIWQAEYSLRNHCKKVSDVVRIVCELLCLDDNIVVVAVIAALMHDIGKLDESCRYYRLNGTLTKEQKSEVDKHAGLSADSMLELMKVVRNDLRSILQDAEPIVRNHHKFQNMINESELMQLSCVILNAVDMFVSLQEDRGDRLGYSQTIALKKLIRKFKRLMKDPAYAHFVWHMEKVLEALVSIFSIAPWRLEVNLFWAKR